MPKRRRTGLCVCGSRRTLLKCCGPFISGDDTPRTPSELMRSRYAAYAFNDADYIIATTDPEGPLWQDDEDAWRESIADFSRRCDFEGVDVMSAKVDGDEATVHFRAKLKQGGDDASFEELSKFVLIDETWLYHKPLA